MPQVDDMQSASKTHFSPPTFRHCPLTTFSLSESHDRHAPVPAVQLAHSLRSWHSGVNEVERYEPYKLGLK